MPSLSRSLAIVLSLGVQAGCQPYGTYGSSGGIWSDRTYSDSIYSDRYGYPYQCPYGAYCAPRSRVYGDAFDRHAYWRAREREARQEEYWRREREAERRMAEQREAARQQARAEAREQARDQSREQAREAMRQQAREEARERAREAARQQARGEPRVQQQPRVQDVSTRRRATRD
jgi:hypothetical protein